MRAPGTKPLTVAVVSVALVVLASACAPPPPPPVAQNPLSLGRGDVLGNGATSGAAISADGRWVAFASAADNLVPGDDNGAADLFLRDRLTGSVIRVREHSGSAPRVSPNGRHVSYVAAGAVGVYDRVTGTAVEWSSTVSFPVVPVVPDDGSVAIYGAPSSFGIFAPACRVRDLASGFESDCPPGGPGFGTLAYEAVSSNGRFVLYHWNDQSGGGTSNRLLWDRTLGTTTVVTAPMTPLGGSSAVSDDGRYVASVFLQPDAPIATVVHDLNLGSRTVLPLAADGNTLPVDISPDGSTVLLVSEATNLVTGDSNGWPDLFVWDIAAKSLARISVATDKSELPTGARRCGQGPGQLLSDGTAGCVLTDDPVVVPDMNGVADAYLLAAQLQPLVEPHSWQA
jgi:hypothetical protein